MNNNPTNTKELSLEPFDAIGIKLASPEIIKSWSHGEVTKPETINYRTGRSERGGLFDERIFGPEKDYECYCGKYRRIRYKGIICEKCGVEVTKSIVRRERMGHIELASPVAHIWFLKGIPSRLALLLNISASDLEKVVYFAGYIVTSVNEKQREQMMKNLDAEYKTKIKQLKDEKARDELKELLTTAKNELNSIHEGVVFDEVNYHRLSLKYGTVFEAEIGARALYDICKKIDLEKLADQIHEGMGKAGAGERAKMQKRIALVTAMIKSQVRPEWMFITVLPIIPPALRPMVPLEGGRHATSDVNDLYRRVINRNNRLRKLMEISAPDVILRNEKRILQEAVDALLDNSMRRDAGAAINPAQKRALKSISDNLKGKQGYFRQNLLGKRVDYSGRSVIVIGSNLRLDQCGLPKHMALELFRPFVISEILRRELAYNIRGANRLIDDGIPEVWEILEEVTKDKYVFLNRAPTLHRLGIQAFKPILIEGNAIQIHPLVCPAFNADFDGDMMAVHVPLSQQAQKESRELIASNKNLLGPGNGEPIVNPGHDIVLGCYWMTRIVEGEKGEGKIFPTPNSATTAYDFGEVGFRARIKVLPTDSPRYAQFEGKPFETSIGRILFNSVFPKTLPFLNHDVTKKDLSEIVSLVITTYGVDQTPEILDKLKHFGFKYATRSGTTWSIADITVPVEKKQLVEGGHKKIAEITEQYQEGLLSKEERTRKSIEVWQNVRNEIEKLMPGTIEKNGSVDSMISSGARGSIGQIVQMSGMKGLIVNTAGDTIDFPILPSNKEGLSPLEYFVSTHGSRKGLADTALNTAKAGYLTRRLVYAADNAIIVEEDCGTKEGKLIKRTNVLGLDVALDKHTRGRVLAKDAVDADGTVLFKKGHLINKTEAREIEQSNTEEVLVRSPLSCKSMKGICRQCYGEDLGRGTLVSVGEPVGIVAAQAIGEPGTQLTMRTFHKGGVAGVDITMGLPRVEEVFERRSPKVKAAVAIEEGMVSEIKEEGNKKTIVTLSDKATKKSGGTIEYELPPRVSPLVEKGETIVRGQIISEGSADLQELFKHAGAEAAEEYIIAEISKIYELQGASISRKHIEVIIRQMFSRSKITDIGDSSFVVGEVVENGVFLEENARLKEEGKTGAKADLLILGIKEVSLTTKSFLSSASFEQTSRTLIDAAIRGACDDLSGLKENVLIGRLIPAGTGFRNQDEKQPDEEEEEVET